MNLKKIGKVFTSKFVVTGPASYEKRIYLAAVSRRLRNSGLEVVGVLSEAVLACVSTRVVLETLVSTEPL